MNAGRMQGACLCGRVRFEIEPPVLRFLHCHCSRCRKSSGASHSTNLGVRVNQLTWTGGEADVVHYRLASAERFGKAFCRACGCPLPRALPGTDWVVVPAGAIDGPMAVLPSEHIHWASRANWGCGASGLPVHEGPPP